MTLTPASNPTPAVCQSRANAGVAYVEVVTQDRLSFAFLRVVVTLSPATLSCTWSNVAGTSVGQHCTFAGARTLTLPRIPTSSSKLKAEKK